MTRAILLVAWRGFLDTASDMAWCGSPVRTARWTMTTTSSRLTTMMVRSMARSASVTRRRRKITTMRKTTSMKALLGMATWTCLARGSDRCALLITLTESARVVGSTLYQGSDLIPERTLYAYHLMAQQWHLT